jgi:hypothetical protein
MHAPFVDKIHGPTDGLLDLQAQPDPVEQGNRLLPSDHQLHVTGGGCFPAADGTKHEDLFRTVLPGKSADFASMGRQDLFDPEAIPEPYGPDLGDVPKQRLAARAHADRRFDRGPSANTSVAVKSRNSDHLHGPTLGVESVPDH